MLGLFTPRAREDNEGDEASPPPAAGEASPSPAAGVGEPTLEPAVVQELLDHIKRQGVVIARIDTEMKTLRNDMDSMRGGEDYTIKPDKQEELIEELPTSPPAKTKRRTTLFVPHYPYTPTHKSSVITSVGPPADVGNALDSILSSIKVDPSVSKDKDMKDVVKGYSTAAKNVKATTPTLKPERREFSSWTREITEALKGQHLYWGIKIGSVSLEARDIDDPAIDPEVRSALLFAAKLKSYVYGESNGYDIGQDALYNALYMTGGKEMETHALVLKDDEHRGTKLFRKIWELTTRNKTNALYDLRSKVKIACFKPFTNAHDDTFASRRLLLERLIEEIDMYMAPEKYDRWEPAFFVLGSMLKSAGTPWPIFANTVYGTYEEKNRTKTFYWDEFCDDCQSKAEAFPPMVRDTANVLEDKKKKEAVYCKFHKKPVHHSEKDCSLNPANAKVNGKGKGGTGGGAAGGASGGTGGGAAGGNAGGGGNGSGGNGSGGNGSGGNGSGGNGSGGNGSGGNGSGGRRTDFTGMTCFKCGKKGHIATHCPEKEKEEANFAGDIECMLPLCTPWGPGSEEHNFFMCKYDALDIKLRVEYERPRLVTELSFTGSSARYDSPLEILCVADLPLYCKITDEQEACQHRKAEGYYRELKASHDGEPLISRAGAWMDLAIRLNCKNPDIDDSDDGSTDNSSDDSSDDDDGDSIDSSAIDSSDDDCDSVDGSSYFDGDFDDCDSVDGSSYFDGDFDDCDIDDCESTFYDEAIDADANAYEEHVDRAFNVENADSGAEECYVNYTDTMLEVPIDSGCSTTVFKTKDYMPTFEEVSRPLLTAGNSTIEIKGEGVATFNICDRSGNKLQVTTPALYCPDARQDLISVSGLDDNFKLVFHKGSLTISNGEQTVEAHKKGQLYYLYIEPIEPAVNVAMLATPGLSIAQIWHLRAAHISMDALVAGSKRILNMPNLTTDATPCHDCIVMKSRRTGPGNLGVLDNSSLIVEKPLDLICGDLSGPWRVTSVGPDGKANVKYALHILDMWTHKIWTLPVPRKSDVPTIFKKWLIDTHARTKYSTRRFHSDNGTEFVSAEFKSICADFNIATQTSSTYEPRQNAFVERSIGTTTRSARTMLATSNAPRCCAWLALAYATEVINAFPLSREYSPDELWNQRLPDASMWYPFGCYVYAWQDRRRAEDPKWSQSGTAGIFCGIGRINNKNSFVVYTPDGSLIYPISIRVDTSFFPYRQRGDQRISSAYFDTSRQTSFDVAWEDDQIVPISEYDDIFTPPIVEGGDDYDDIVQGGDDGDIIDDGDKNDGINDDDKNGDADIDWNLPDGTYALDYVDRTVTMFWKKDRKHYHGTIQRVTYDDDTKNKNRVIFHVYFSEDTSWMQFRFPRLKRILDEKEDIANFADIFNPNDDYDIAYGANDAVDEAQASYKPDIIATRKEMLLQDDREAFERAEEKEIENMQIHNVLEWTKIPPGKRLIKSKFCYRRKRDSSGAIVKWKARLVAKGFSQIAGVDFDSTFASTASAVAFRMLIALALLYDLTVTGGDVDGAFLNGELDPTHDLYMAPPDGYQDPTGQGRVFKLRKSIYGLRQAAHCWNKLLKTTLNELGYVALDGSQSLFVLHNGIGLVSIICFHVDDWAHAWNAEWLDQRIVSKFTELWGVSNVGPITYHLGMSINIVKGEKARISQRTYLEKILTRFGFLNITPVSTPLDPTVKLSTSDAPQEIDVDDRRLYLEMYGSLLYASVMSRPDLSNAMTVLGRFMANPGKKHVVAIKRVFRYIAGTLDLGLEFRKGAWLVPGLKLNVPATELIEFGDSDWAGDVDKRNSTSAYTVHLAHGPIAWRSTLQRIQALSSAEAEYVSMSDASKEVLYIRGILDGLPWFNVLPPTKMLVDSTAAISIATKHGINGKTKHIALRYHFVRKLIEDKVIEVVKVPTADNVSDILTKAVDRVTFQRLVPYLVC